MLDPLALHGGWAASTLITTQLAWLVWATVLHQGAVAAPAAASHQEPQGEQPQHPTCKPQGLLELDAPYPRPRRTLSLPLCPQFTCTCCTKQHVAGLYRLLAPALQHQQHAGVSQAAAQGSGQPRAGEGGQDGGEAEGLAGGDDGVDEEEAGGQGGLGGQAPVGLSGRCADMMALMACRVCDPEVGLGQKPAVCRATCKAWHAACGQHFFTFDPLSGMLVGCPAGGPGPDTAAPGQEPCVRLRDMAGSGEELCELAGLPVADPPTPCYSGADPAMPSGVCEPMTSASPPSPARAKRSIKKPKKKGPADHAVNMRAVGLLLAGIGVLGYLWTLGGPQGALRACRRQWARLQQRLRRMRARGRKLGSR